MEHQALNEDIRALKDGCLRCGYIDKNNVLRIVKVEEPVKIYVVIITSFSVLVLASVIIALYLKYKKKDLNESITPLKGEAPLINN